MHNSRLFAALVGVLLIGAAIGYGLTTWLRPAPATMAVAGERKILYWHDPMVPNQRFEHPGKSPFMDMQLVPVYADDGAGGVQVKIDPAVAQNLGLRLGKVERGSLSLRLSAVGAVAYDERLLQVVQARVDGYVSRLHVKSTLVPVRRGQPLADIVAPTWFAAQQEYLALLDTQSQRGGEIRAAARQRLAVLGMAESAIQHLEADRKASATTTLYAPVDGVVAELGVREGAQFMAGAPLFRINSLHKVWAVAQIPEAQVSAVNAGAKVSVRATAWPEETFKGRVMALLPDVDAATRTLPLRIEIENPGSRLVPGMFVSMDFEMPAETPQLLVPSEAVIVTGSRSVVIVARQSGGFDVVDVKIGRESGGRTAILSGLEEGQSVVTSGQFLIDSEASLKSTVARLTTP